MTTQPQDAHFDGATYQPKRDYERLRGQMLRVFDAMKDGEWRTLEQISDITSDPQASISARLRDLRKSKFGEFDVRRQYVRSGLYQYKIAGACA